MPTNITQQEVEDWVDLAAQWVSSDVAECEYIKTMWSNPVCKNCSWLNFCGVLVDIICNVRSEAAFEGAEQDG